MLLFPYFDILKKASVLTYKNTWLWFFGLFIGSNAVLNTNGLNLFFRPGVSKFFDLKAAGTKVLAWAAEHFEVFSLIIIGSLVVLALLVMLSATCLGAVIWAVPKLEKKNQNIDFRKVLQFGRRYLWRVAGLQILTTSFFLVFLGILGSPIVYLFALGAVGRAVVLLLIGLAIFIPAFFVFAFVHLYGPIFVVLFERNIKEAIFLSFNLLRKKLLESMILAAFLLGVNFLFILVSIFSIILFSAPVAVLAWLLLKLGLVIAFKTLVMGAALAILIYLFVLHAGFAIFQTTTWVFAVLEMVNPVKFGEEQKVFAAEPA